DPRTAVDARQQFLAHLDPGNQQKFLRLVSARGALSDDDACWQARIEYGAVGDLPEEPAVLWARTLSEGQSWTKILLRLTSRSGPRRSDCRSRGAHRPDDSNRSSPERRVDIARRDGDDRAQQPAGGVRVVSEGACAARSRLIPPGARSRGEPAAVRGDVYHHVRRDRLRRRGGRPPLPVAARGDPRGGYQRFLRICDRHVPHQGRGG